MDANEQSFYRRMNEIGEYKYNSRMDTIYIFQIIFIFILTIIGLLYLKSINIITPFFTFPIIIFLTVIVIFIFINKLVFTNRIRDGKNWNELRFGKVPPPDYIFRGTKTGSKGLVNVVIPDPSACPTGQQMRPAQCAPI